MFMKRCPAEIDAARQPELACLQSLLFDEEQGPAGGQRGPRRAGGVCPCLSVCLSGPGPGCWWGAVPPAQALSPSVPGRAGQDVQKRRERVLQGEGLRESCRRLHRGAEEEVRGPRAERRAAHKPGSRAVLPG